MSKKIYKFSFNLIWLFSSFLYPYTAFLSFGLRRDQVFSQKSTKNVDHIAEQQKHGKRSF